VAAVAEVAETVAPAQLPVQARLMPVHPALLLPGALSFRPLRPLRPKPPLQGHVAHRPQTPRRPLVVVLALTGPKVSWTMTFLTNS